MSIVSWYQKANPVELAKRMQYLIDNPDEARRMGDNACELALSRFGLDRFIRDWNAVFAEASAVPSLR